MQRDAGTRYATREQAIAAELKHAAISPDTLGATLDNRFGKTFVVQGPESHVGPVTQGYVDAVAELNAAGGGRLVFPQRKALLRVGMAAITVGNVEITSVNGTEIIADQAFPANGASLIQISGAGIGSPLATLTTSVTDPRNTYEISVSSEAPFAPGDLVMIKARPHASNYFYGISNRPGFAPVYYSESVRVRDTADGLLKLAAALRYPYAVAEGVVVDIYKVSSLNNVSVSGLRGVGLGPGPGNIWNGYTGSHFIQALHVEGFTAESIDARRFNSAGVNMTNVRKSNLRDINVIGIDYSDPNAAGLIDNAHAGIQWVGCEDGLWTGGNIENVRHATDLSSTSTTPICNNTIVIGVTADGVVGCVFGGHVCDNHRLIGCGAQRGGAYMRGKNWAVIACDFDASGSLDEETGEGTDTSGGIVAGNGYSTLEYDQSPNMGICRVIANKIRGANGVVLRNSCDGLIVESNQFDCNGTCVNAYGKSFRDFQFNGNTFDMSRRVGNRYAVQFGYSDIPLLETLFNIGGNDNTAIEATAVYRIAGTRYAANPADAIMFVATTMINVATTPSAVASFRQGFFGYSYGVDGITVVGNVPNDIVNLDDELGRHAARPQISGYNRREQRNVGYSNNLPTLPRQNIGLFDTWQRTGSVTKHICTVPGTIGTLTGVTGSIAATSNVLALASVEEFEVMRGMYLLVPGAGVASADLVGRVVSVTLTPGTNIATACVLDTAAGTAVSNVAIAYRNPTWQLGASFDTADELAALNASVADLETGMATAAVAVATVTILKTRAIPANGTVASTRGRLAAGDGGRGDWMFSTADCSALVARDPLNGLSAAPASAPTGASGAWLRQYSGRAKTCWWGDTMAAIRACSVALGPNAQYIEVTPATYTSTTVGTPVISATNQDFDVDYSKAKIVPVEGGDTFIQVVGDFEGEATVTAINGNVLTLSGGTTPPGGTGPADWFEKGAVAAISDGITPHYFHQRTTVQGVYSGAFRAGENVVAIAGSGSTLTLAKAPEWASDRVPPYLATLMNRDISSVSDNGSGLVRIVTTKPHRMTTGLNSFVAGLTGTPLANGYQQVIVINPTTVDLVGTTYIGSGVTSGTIRKALTYSTHAAAGLKIGKLRNNVLRIKSGLFLADKSIVDPGILIQVVARKIDEITAPLITKGGGTPVITTTACYGGKIGARGGATGQAGNTLGYIGRANGGSWTEWELHVNAVRHGFDTNEPSGDFAVGLAGAGVASYMTVRGSSLGAVVAPFAMHAQYRTRIKDVRVGQTLSGGGASARGVGCTVDGVQVSNGTGFAGFSQYKGTITSIENNGSGLVRVNYECDIAMLDDDKIRLMGATGTAGSGASTINKDWYILNATGTWNGSTYVGRFDLEGSTFTSTSSIQEAFFDAGFDFSDELRVVNCTGEDFETAFLGGSNAGVQEMQGNRFSSRTIGVNIVEAGRELYIKDENWRFGTVTIPDTGQRGVIQVRAQTRLIDIDNLTIFAASDLPHFIDAWTYRTTHTGDLILRIRDLKIINPGYSMLSLFRNSVGFVPSAGSSIGNVTIEGTLSEYLGGKLLVLDELMPFIKGTLKVNGKIVARPGSLITSRSLGTVTSGTLTLDPAGCDIQHYTNNGAHTLAPSTDGGDFTLDITNGASAGAITTSGWTKVAGDSFTTTNGHKFRCRCTIGNGGSLLEVRAMQ
ncbi:hypothetical protein [Reyranella sp.]|uniref:hypothetical protein n=1 Tax=Reyranella sp. TaxID=1929291 RepID=UPI003D150DAC